ncbi:MAG: YdeI family protein [Candidatus Margulisiibacteriota bacterium]
MTHPQVDDFLAKAKTWAKEFKALRHLVLDSELTETLKWGQPCYTLGDKNIVLIHGFKDYCALLFFKGALLDDPHGLLVQQTENVQAARQIRFTTLEQINAQAPLLKTYLQNAIAIEKAGLKVAFKASTNFAAPEEFQVYLDEDADLKTAFEALTPGRQRAYLLYFGGAKQAKTREDRVKKHLGRILERKGLDD